MENLNKDNFWNAMTAKYPVAMKNFCAWVDEYKRENNWNNLFNHSITNNQELPGPKFHDLPLAMQIGIWFQFMAQHSAEPYSTRVMKENIEEDLKSLEVILS